MLEIKFTVDPKDAVPLNVFTLINGCIDAVNETNQDAHKMLDDTKKDFSEDSDFEFKESRRLTPKEASASTFTTNENWVRLNNGFYIPPVTGKFMAFQADYRPKTRPFTPRSRPGGPTGPWVYTHKRKGTEVQGRGWIITIYSLLRGKFYKRIDAAFKAALRG